MSSHFPLAVGSVGTDAAHDLCCSYSDSCHPGTGSSLDETGLGGHFWSRFSPSELSVIASPGSSGPAEGVGIHAVSSSGQGPGMLQTTPPPPSTIWPKCRGAEAENLALDLPRLGLPCS